MPVSKMRRREGRRKAENRLKSLPASTWSSANNNPQCCRRDRLIPVYKFDYKTIVSRCSLLFEIPLLVVQPFLFIRSRLFKRLFIKSKILV